MFHLVKDNVSGIENNLIWARTVRDSIFSWWFNITLLVLVVGSFAYFMWASYGTAVPEELKQIPFEPNVWHNAVKKVPVTDYGQTPQVEAGDGLPGLARRTGASDF
jgi:hypothetical protein